MSNLISIIIPVYNVEDYIREALDSVINQTYKDLEIILVDDGSSDNSGKICDEYAEKDSRIKVIHKENGGVSSARNAGMEISTGDWLYFMDPDDWIELNAFELVLAKAEETNADMIVFDNDLVYEKYSKPQKSIVTQNKYFFDKSSSADIVAYYSMRGSACVFLTRAKTIKNTIKFDANIKVAEDLLFKLECYQYINSFAYLPIVLYHYRYRPGSACNSKIVSNMSDAINCYNAITAIKSNDIDYTVVANCYFLNRFCQIVDFTLGNKALSAIQKKEIINEYIKSNTFKKAIANYDKRMLRKMFRIIISMKNPTVFKIRCVYLLKKVKARVDKLKYRRRSEEKIP